MEPAGHERVATLLDAVGVAPIGRRLFPEETLPALQARSGQPCSPLTPPGRPVCSAVTVPKGWQLWAALGSSPFCRGFRTLWAQPGRRLLVLLFWPQKRACLPLGSMSPAATGSGWGAPPQTPPLSPGSLELPRSGVMTSGPSVVCGLQFSETLDLVKGLGRFSQRARGSGCWHVGGTLAGGDLRSHCKMLLSRPKFSPRRSSQSGAWEHGRGRAEPALPCRARGPAQ